MAVEALNVKADLNATMTLGIASRVLWKVAKSVFTVHLSSCVCMEPSIYCQATTNSEFCASQIQEVPDFLCVQKMFNSLNQVKPVTPSVHCCALQSAVPFLHTLSLCSCNTVSVVLLCHPGQFVLP